MVLGRDLEPSRPPERPARAGRPGVRLHLRGALNNGVSREEIQEVLLQTTVYCGVPAALESFRIAARC